MPVPSGSIDDMAGAAAAIEAAIFARAGAVDAAAAYPALDIAALAEVGLLTPRAYAAETLATVLTTIGRASLTVGRLFEGHVNAVTLAATYGGDEARTIIAADAAAGRPSGVWNAERGGGVVATRVDGGWRLTGRKVHCSGAGSLRRPVVTARDGDAVRMFLPDLAGPGIAIDVSVWRANGMRGTATGTVDFDCHVPNAAVIGDADDYYRSPLFSGGAWRVLAVQLGGLDRIMALHAERLIASERDGDAIVRARFAQAAAGHEAARLIVAEAARRAEGDGDAAAIDAYVDLARGGFEEFALGIVAATRRNVGLGTYIAPDPLDRCLRDLETYLRQPFLDASRDHAARWLIARGGRFA